MKKGITLVALVVTIIILLILATVTISLILGDNSLFERTQQGKAKTQLTQVGERLQNAATAMLADILSEAIDRPSTLVEARDTLKDYVSPADEGKFGTGVGNLDAGTAVPPSGPPNSVAFNYVEGDYTLTFTINFVEVSAVYEITP